MASLPLAVGQAIELTDGRRAAIRFLGTTEFAPGEWIGVELDEGSGKNDGSVKGDRYFDCEPNHGMFLRAAGVGRILDKPKTRAAANAVANGSTPARSRPSSVGTAPGRGPVLDSKRRESILSPAARSPAKSPTKSLASSAATSRTSTPPSAAAAAARRPTSTLASKPRTSLAPTPSLASRRTSTIAPSSAAAAAHGRTVSRTTPAGSAAALRAAARPGPSRPSLAPQRAASSRLSPAPSELLDDHDAAERPHSPLGSPASELPAKLDSEDRQQHARAGRRGADSAEHVEDEEEDDEAETHGEEPALAPVRPFAPPLKPAALPTPARSRRAPSPSASLASQRTGRSIAGPSREVEELQAKMKVFERKRMEDRERLKKLAEVEQERDKYGSIVQKMQQKMQTQSQELAEMRKALKDSEASLIDIEGIQAEHDAVVEMATLDREMAEETAEVLRTEVEALRSKTEEMELELDILREENQELGREMNPEDRTSQGWLQLERSNERLREALLRLRDVTQEQEAELKAQIKALEDDAKDTSSVRKEYEETKEKLLETEADIEDLRQQLEVALGAEDMIEELTERNLSLQEKMDELHAAIDDLESLKELTDELEVNHVEAEKQMQEEIDFKDSLINEHTRRSAQQQQTIEDCEYTISRFRDLVTNMQTDLEDMRASQQITETEAEELSTRSRAMLDLNMKLQVSAAKTQVKTIDLELRRLQAEEAAEHLAIVQLFLPEAFHNERDSVLALLRFKRIGFKSNLIHGFVKERVNGQGHRPADEDVFAACSVLDRLTWITGMSERFVNSICTCSVAEFAKYESALYEIEPVERALNNYIDALKREELRESRVDEELQRSMAVMSHLASLHIKDSLPSYADDVLMRTSLIQSNIETAASAFVLCKSLIQKNVALPATDDLDGVGSNENLMEKLDIILAHTRGAKVIASKTYRALSDLRSRSLALQPSTLDTFVSAEQAASKLAAFGRNAGETLHALFEEEGRENPFTMNETALALSRLSTGAFGLTSPESTTLAALSSHLRSLTDRLSDMGALPADLENTTEFERAPAPWTVRSAELHETKLTSADTEAEVLRLNEVVRERSILVRAKEQELEEQSVRIEMLEARMAEAQKRSSQLADLETALRTLKLAEKKIQDQLTEAQKDTSRLRRERDEWRRTAEERKPEIKGTNNMAAEMGSASKVELDRAKLKIDSLESALRYLQSQNATRLSKTLLTDDWLTEPLVPPPTRQARLVNTLQSEGKAAISELLRMVSNAKPVDLTTLPENKLAWRPAKETSLWISQRRRQDYAGWQEWEDDLLQRARGVTERSRRELTATYGSKFEPSAADRLVIVGEHEHEQDQDQDQETW
ncbi:hypothetical protein MBLNU459_g3417t3 [Dothideomycetes sp. NU459]